MINNQPVAYKITIEQIEDDFRFPVLLPDCVDVVILGSEEISRKQYAFEVISQQCYF